MVDFSDAPTELSEGEIYEMLYGEDSNDEN